MARGALGRTLGLVLVAFVGLVALVVACASPPEETLPVTEAAVVRFGQAEGAARLNGGVVEVLLLTEVDGIRRVSVMSSGPARGGETSVRLVSYGGNTGEEWNAFVFGTAPPGASRVVLDGFDGVGGKVVGGTWLIVLREKDVEPPDLSWRFLAPDGTEIDRGEGILIPGS